MTEPAARAKEILRGSASLVKEEILFFVRSFFRAFLRGTGVVALILFAYLLFAYFREPSDASPVIAVVFLFGYSIFIGLHFGLIAGGLSVAWGMAGAFIVVPLVVIPLSVASAFWLGYGVLEGQAQSVLDALAASAESRDWLVLGVGPAARAGPVILVIALPLLAIDLVAVVLDGGVLLSLLGFLLLASLFFLVGFVPSAIFSLAVLVVAYVKRFRARHRERIAAI